MLDSEVPVGWCACGCGETTALATRTDSRSGRICGTPLRFVIGHNPRKRGWPFHLEDAPLGFDPSLGQCWLWDGQLDKDGYGIFFRDGKRHAAHRWVYEKQVGPIPISLQPDHLCRRRNCVNNSHIELVTPAENTRRGKVPKLHIGDVLEIRSRSDLSATDLAQLHGIAVRTVNSIRRGERWRDISVSRAA